MVRGLTEDELQHYREPFLDPSTRKPLYRWPNEAPMSGQPAELPAIIQAYHDWLVESDIPKLFLYGSPGAIIKADLAEYYRGALKNTRSIHTGEGRHWLVEDNPHLIGSEIARWLSDLVM